MSNPTKDSEASTYSFVEQPAFLYILLSGVMVVAAANFGMLLWYTDDPAKRGQFGDSFGGINALFTGLAFAAVIYGIILQRREIKLQQRELVETREVFRQQSFETLFFNVQRVLAETVSAIEWKILVADRLGQRLEPVHGRPALKAIAESVYQQYYSRLKIHAQDHSGQEPSPASQLEWLLEEYEKFYWENESLLGNYFRLVYNVMKLVSESYFSAIEKERYAHLFRAQLSEGELTLIVLNGMVDMGEKMRRYLEEFAMLKHATMEGRSIPKPAAHYGTNAFLDLDERVRV